MIKAEENTLISSSKLDLCCMFSQKFGTRTSLKDRWLNEDLSGLRAKQQHQKEQKRGLYTSKQKAY